VRIVVRGDSGFCREELMAWCEANRVDYLLGLAKNERLKAEIEKERGEAKAQYQETGRAAWLFKEFVYQTRESWSRARRVVAKAETSAPDRRPLMLWAADRLAERLPSVIANDKSQDADWAEWRTQLASFGITYEPSSDADGPLAYTGGLLKRIWTDYRQSEWGERAFLVLQSHGWDMGPSCEAGSDRFHAVIQQGLPFLEQHPKSPDQLDVQLTVAQAYETWWSLSQPQVTTADESSEYVDTQKYQEGAEAARQKGIAYYERLLQTAPQSDQAAYARRVLPRLKLGIDTGQRRFYCTYED
jgi:hypothetical protein